VIGLLFSVFVPVPDNIASAILWLCGFGDVTGRLQSIAESAFGAALPPAFLWLGGWIYYKIRKREGLGLGDVKLIAMVGAFLGLRGALLTLVLGSFSGSLLPAANDYNQAFKTLWKNQPKRTLPFRFGYRDRGSKNHLLVTRTTDMAPAPATTSPPSGGGSAPPAQPAPKAVQ